MERKIQLLTQLAESEASVKMYRDLLDSTEKAVRKINAELNDSYQPGNSRYTQGELVSVRRRIVGLLSEMNSWIFPRALFDAIPEHCSELIMRELHKLVANAKSDVVWNGHRGSASQYRRFRAAVA